jgi:hypothetical protein
MRFRPTLAFLLALTAVDLVAQQHEFRFDGARPLGKAAQELEEQYGWIVTYEDVPVFGADTKDVTAEVRKDHDATAKNRIIVPRGSPFGFAVDEKHAREPGQIGAGRVVANLLEAYHRSRNPGKFQGLVTRAGGRLVFHLVPIEIRDEHGQPAAYRSPLEARISVPFAKRSIHRLLDEIGARISEASGVHVDANSAIASNYFIQTQIEDGAKDEVARDVLRRVLIEDTGRPFSWRMFCETGWGCALNPHLVSAK